MATDTGIVVTQRPNIGRVANLARAAGVSIDRLRIGTAVCDGAFAALVLERTTRSLQQNPAPAQERALREANRAAFEFLVEAGAIA